jgi:microcystin-dependent protein
MTGYTQPDLLPFPDNYNAPADVPADVEALAQKVQEVLTERDAIASLMAPIGAIVMWPQASAPAGWHLCNGTTHGSSALAAVLGGATVTPDLRNRFIVGAGGDVAVGGSGGAASMTLTEANLPSHTHVKILADQTTNPGYQVTPVAPPGSGFYDGLIAHSPQSREVGYTGGNQPFENRPPYYALTYIIRKG